MGFEEEMFHELATNTWDKRSRMQQEMVKGAKGEPFAVQELYRKGPLTPSQLASSMKTTTGRVSTLLSALEKKGQITRESDPDDRRVVHVNLTEAGRERAERQRESMREAICWIFSQMGERRTREFVDLLSEFSTYMAICHPGAPRPTPDEVRAAFAERDRRVADHMRAERAKAGEE